MTLEEFLKKRHPNIKIATTTEDSEKLLELYNNKSMSGESYNLSYHRQPDYYEFLKLHQSQYFIVLGTEDNKALATGTFILREGLFEGKRVKYLYHCDLRAKQNRKATKLWRKFYVDFMDYIEKGILEEFHDIKAHYAVVLADNKIAIKTLEKKYNFKILKEFKMRNILKKKIFRSSVKLSVQKTKDLKQFENRLNDFYKNKFLGYSINLSHLLKLWSTKNHYGAFEVKDEDGLVIGGAIIWSPKESKRIIVHTNSFLLKTVSNIASLIFNFPKNNDELKLLYISHMHYKESNKSKVMESLIDKALDIKKQHSYHLVSIQDLDDNQMVFNKFINIEKNVRLYTIGDAEYEKVDAAYEISLA